MSSGLQELLDLLAEPEMEYLPPELAPLPLTVTLTSENPIGLQASSEGSNPVSKKLKLDSPQEKQESNKESLVRAMELRDEEVRFVNSFLNPLWDSTDPIFETHYETALSSTKNESRPFSEKESPSLAVTMPGNEKVLRDLRGSESDRQFVGTPRIERCRLYDGRGRWGHLTTTDPLRKYAILRRSRGFRIE